MGSSVVGVASQHSTVELKKKGKDFPAKGNKGQFEVDSVWG